eukprot:1196283-Prorocentrum_minimum.AAC.5
MRSTPAWSSIRLYTASERASSTAAMVFRCSGGSLLPSGEYRGVRSKSFTTYTAPSLQFA